METEAAVPSEVSKDTNKEMSPAEESSQENHQKVPEILLQEDEVTNECDPGDQDKTMRTKDPTGQRDKGSTGPLSFLKEDFSQLKEGVLKVFRDTDSLSQAENKPASRTLDLLKEDLSQFKEDVTSVFSSSKETKSTDPKTSQSTEKTINRLSFLHLKDDLSSVFRIGLSKERDNKGVTAKEDSSNTFKTKAERTDEPFLQSLFRKSSRRAVNGQEVKKTFLETSEEQTDAGFRGNLSEQNKETVNTEKINTMKDGMDKTKDSEVDKTVSEEKTETTTSFSETQQSEEVIPASQAAEQRRESKEWSDDSSVGLTEDKRINGEEEEKVEEEEEQQQQEKEKEEEEEKQEEEEEKEEKEEEEEEKQEEEEKDEKEEEEEEKEEKEEEEKQQQQEKEKEEEEKQEEEEEKEEKEEEEEKQEEEEEKEEEEEEEKEEKEEEEEKEKEKEEEEEDKSSETLPWEPLSSGISLFSLRDPNKDDIRGQTEGDMWSVKNFACYLTLDPNTANSELHLTDCNRKATRVWSDHPPLDHPDRFERCPQVLCREGLLDSVYWEVVWSGGADIGVTYNNISRDGDTASCLLGHNERSWSLECSEGSYTPCHLNKRFRSSSPRPFTHRVGVYLNWSAGTLSFYCVSQDAMFHLHTFTSTFTEPLYPGFWVWAYDGSVSLCQVELDWERLLQ